MDEMFQERVARAAAALRAWTERRFDPDLVPALTGELRIIARRLEDVETSAYTRALRKAL